MDDTAVTLDGSVHVHVVRGQGRRLVGARPAGGQLAERERLDAQPGEAFDEGAVVATPDTLYFGFGFEGISSAAERNAVMGRAMDHLLP